MAIRQRFALYRAAAAVQMISGSRAQRKALPPSSRNLGALPAARTHVRALPSRLSRCVRVPLLSGTGAVSPHCFGGSAYPQDQQTFLNEIIWVHHARASQVATAARVALNVV